MILADKIIEERKKNGWSQEELAEKLDVSRQSVSKWEGAQSTPDLQKILKMSELFGVSTDYLLKDDMENAEYVETSEEEGSVRKISMEEANAFLELNKKLATGTALATALAVLCPVCLIFMAGMTEYDPNMENVAVSLGMIWLFAFIAAAVSIFIMNGMKISKYEYLEKEMIETAYGVSGMVKDKKEKYAEKHIRNIIAGVVLCIIGVIAIFQIPLLGDTDFIGASMVCIMFLFEAAGAFFLVKTSCIQSGFDKLLQEDDYTPEKKKDKVSGVISTVYWLLATAVFLVWSFITNSWEITWIVWAVAGVLYPAVLGIAKLIKSKK
ncbi:MAG: helix-turn-helix transcriptional regulator [Ruminiclostridium sp.]|nr:helix-turn-helix transcriptional regulator [Ruminiclostridium sp.]